MNIDLRLKKIEDKVIPKIQTIIYKINKIILSERELSMLRARDGTEEKDDYILVKYIVEQRKKYK